MNKVKQKLAVVTGASSGIGGAIALALGQHGYRLLLVGRNERRLAAVSDEAREHACDVDFCTADLSEPSGPRALARQIEQSHGSVDLLIHSAGVIRFDGDGSNTQMVVNFTAPRDLTELLLPLLIENQGEIVFVNSSVALHPATSKSKYAESKIRLKNYADELRDKVNRKGVRVLSIYPGRTATPMQEKVFQAEARPYAPDQLLQPKNVATMVMTCIELPRTAEVTDIAIRPMKKA